MVMNSFEVEEMMVGHSSRKTIRERSWKESKEMWVIAAPAILSSSILYWFCYGCICWEFRKRRTCCCLCCSVCDRRLRLWDHGMGSAQETLCRQAVGAGYVSMVGIYMQRSLIITIVTALLLTPLYIFTSPLLKLLHQSESMSELAGTYAIWTIPQLFAYALNFPIQRFLQAQRKIWVMTVISILILAFHIILNWVIVTKLGYGLIGAAVAGNISWWVMVVAQFIYVVSGFFPEAWTGFTLVAFKSLGGFVELSIASGVMLCLELWYYTIVTLMVGWLKNPEIAVGAISICMNLQRWTLMITLGFNAAVSVRVSNELGAGHPRAAKFSVIVAFVTSTLFGIFFTIATLAGVAVGAGWQFSVALINIGCYYAFGLPLGALLGYKFNLGVKGIWSGMLAGCLLQTVILVFYLFRTNWIKEGVKAEKRMCLHASSPLAAQDGREAIGL